MDRRDTRSLLRDYGIPMQDNSAYSLSYGKDSSKDPRKAGPKKPKVTVPGKPVKTKEWLKDKTGLLKIKQAPAMKEGGKITKLDPDQEKTFQSWYKRTSSKLGLDPDPDGAQQFYDYRGFYKENGDVPMVEGQHFTDTYKLPGHPTFSNESKYADFYNRDQQGYWATMESGKGQDNYVKLSEKKLPMKKQLGGVMSPADSTNNARLKGLMSVPGAVKSFLYNKNLPGTIGEVMGKQLSTVSTDRKLPEATNPNVQAIGAFNKSLSGPEMDALVNTTANPFGKQGWLKNIVFNPKVHITTDKVIGAGRAARGLYNLNKEGYKF